MFALADSRACSISSCSITCLIAGEGHLTYLCSDSYWIAEDMVDDICGQIRKEFGKNNLPTQPRVHE